MRPPENFQLQILVLSMVLSVWLSHEEAVKCWDYGQVHLDTRRFNSHGFYFLRKGFGTVVFQILVSSFIK